MPMFNGRPGIAPGHFFNAVAQAADRPGRGAPPTVEQVVERVLERYDADDDQSVTLDEVLAVADPEGTDTDAAAEATEAVAAIDSDDDDALSTTELTAAATAEDTDGDGLLEHEDHASGDEPGALGSLLQAGRGGHGRPDGNGSDGSDGGADGDATPPTIAAVVEHVFDHLDDDDSGDITLDEVLDEVDPDGDDTDAAADATEAFDAIDTNADDSLSMSEVTAQVSAADADADGSISRDERADTGVSALLRGPRGDGGGPGGGRTPWTVADAVDHVLSRFDDNGDEVIPMTELLAVLDPDGERTALQEKLDAMFDAVDTDDSGGLSLSELTATFTALDSDGDGALTHADRDAADASNAGDIALIGILLHPHGGPGHPG